MGILISVVCRNKDCHYHEQLRLGGGFSLHKSLHILKQQILNGEKTTSSEIRVLLENGSHFEGYHTFSCPTCQEWVSENHPLIIEPTEVSPYGTIRDYKVHYLDGIPHCKNVTAH